MNPDFSLLLLIATLAALIFMVNDRPRERRRRKSRLGASKLGISLVLGAWCLMFSALPCRAETDPPEKPAQEQQQQNNSSTSTEKPPVQRKEETDEAAERASRVQKMAAHFRSKSSLADSIASANARAEKAESALAALQTKFDALTKERDQLKADWKALEEAALEPGEGTSEAAQSASAAINGQVGKELRNMGHKPKEKLPDTANTLAPKPGEPLTREQQASVNRDFWSSRNAPWARN